MAEKKQSPIIRREKFVVESSEINDYGDLVIISKEEVEYKISKKRAHLFDVFQPGIEVEVGYSNYMDRDYIAQASVVSANVSISPSVETSHKVETAKPGKAQWKDNSASIETQVAFKGAVELMVAKIIDDKHPLFKQAISYAEGKLPQIALEPPRIETPKAKTTASAEVLVPEITYQSVYKEIKELISQGVWRTGNATGMLDEFGGTGQTGLDKIKSLPMEKLLQLSARVKEAKKSHLAEAAKQMGAAEVVELGDIPY